MYFFWRLNNIWKISSTYLRLHKWWWLMLFFQTLSYSRKSVTFDSKSYVISVSNLLFICTRGYIYLLLLFSHIVMSDSLQPHGLQHARFPCRACSNSFAWCHPTILFSVIPFFSCLQSFPASGSFLMSWLFTLGGQSIGASASVLPMNIQDWSPLGLTGLISLQYKGLSRTFSNTPVQKHKFFSTQSSLWSNSHIHIWLLEKP